MIPVCGYCEDPAEWFLDDPHGYWCAWACSHHAAKVWSASPTPRVIPASAVKHYRRDSGAS